LDVDRLASALANLNRASSTAPEEVTRLFTDWLYLHSDQWSAVLTVAATQAGSALTALERMTNEEPCVLPLADLAQAIPFGHIVFSRLGLTVDSRRLQELRANSAADPTDLAGLLDQVSIRLSQAGDRQGALASITEAVRIRRALAEASPAAYLPNLAGSLNNLVRLLNSPLATNEDPWREVIADFSDPLSRAELRAGYAQTLFSNGKHGAAIEQLAVAATEADSGDAASLGRARRAIRQAADALGTDDPQLPRWATGPLPDDHIQLMNLWAAQRDWPAVDAFLAEYAEALRHDDFRASLSVAADLFPDSPSLTSLASLINDLDSCGLDAVLVRQPHFAS
jgi:hypothetical protein